MGLAFGTFTYSHLITYSLTVRPHDDPERYARFMSACNRYLWLGRNFFRFPTAVSRPSSPKPNRSRSERDAHLRPRRWR